MNVPPPICGLCDHFRGENAQTCSAFPEGIPEIIYVGTRNGDSGYTRFDHTKPYRGDRGIQFKPKIDAPDGETVDGEDAEDE